MRLTEEQQKQFVVFVVNFIRIAHEETDATKEQIEVMTQLAAATLLGAVFHVPCIDDGTFDETDAFAVKVIELALKLEYSSTEAVKDAEK